MERVFGQPLSAVQGVSWLIANLLYGAGLRLTEGLRLRVKDIDFTANHIVVRESKGDKDRLTMLPSVVKAPLTAHLVQVRALHHQDLARGFGRVALPDALDRKYRNAAAEWGWQWVFPASHLSVDPRSGIQRRHHLYESVPQRALKEAARKIGLTKPANPHILRTVSTYYYSFQRMLYCSGSSACLSVMCGGLRPACTA
jgi:integrase